MLAAGAVMVGSAAGVTVITLDPEMVLLHASVNVHESVSVPPHPVTVPLLVAVTLPEIKHDPLAELLYASALGAGIDPQATVISVGGVVNTAGGAGVTVITLVTGASALPHASVAVHVSVMVPPHGPGAAEKVEALEVPVI